MTSPKVPEVLDNKTPGFLVDMIFSLREQRKLIEARVDLIKADEKRVEDHLLERMTKHELNALSGKLAKCSVTKQLVPQVEDWDKLRAWIDERDAEDLRTKALNASAFRARWEAGEVIPGVVKFNRINLSVRKL
jgi:hypothetical protein